MAKGLLHTYLESLRLAQSVGVAETSNYPALKSLFDAVGETLKPKVTLILHPRNQGAGIPDGGLFLETRAKRTDQADLFKDDNNLPDRGALEVKPPTEDVDKVAQSEQGKKYTGTYGHLLITNLRHFALYRRTTTGPEKIDEIVLASTVSEFQALLQNPAKAEAQHGAALEEFLARSCMAGVPLDKPETVASYLASYAREALKRAENAPDTQALENVRKALEEALGITFDAEKGRHFFLSTLVQTLFYGLFSGWVLWHENNPNTTEPFRRGDTVDYLRVPMVDLLFQNLAGPKTLEPLRLKELLDRAVDVLNRIERGPFFAAFDEGDAVQYFYEPFLAAFDPELRKQLGVWYTPKEIVRYQVQRVDQVLRHQLGLAEGLADENVVVLDPCCGTGTYLVEVMALIESRLSEKYGTTLAPAKVKQAALHRIFGFELIPAPYVVAHLQLGLLLNRKHAGLEGNERAQVYLTNALTGWNPEEDTKKQYDIYGLKEEREAALQVKRQAPILVILGNPPYNGYAGTSESDEERELTNFYRTVEQAPTPQGQGLNDLYVRFFRMAERRIVEGDPGRGIISFISNYSWLDSLSCPGMRERFLEVFDEIWVDNLHGDRIISEYAPDGSTSQTVFAIPGQSLGIKVGTAITTLAVTGQKEKSKATARLWYKDHDEGDAAKRRASLLASALDESFQEGYTILKPKPRLGFPFKPRDVSDAYLDWPTLPELIPTSFPGIKTSRDDFLVDIDRERLESRIAEYFDPTRTNDQIASRYPSIMTSVPRFDAQATRSALVKRGPHPEGIRKYFYRPFDTRWMYWDPFGKLLDEKRTDYVQQFISGNYALSLAKDNRRGFDPPLTSCELSGFHVIERGTNFFPLNLVAGTSSPSLFTNPEEIEANGISPNLSCIGLDVLRELSCLDHSLAFFHALATMHSPAYREANSGALRQDWPRIPWPKSLDALPANKETLRTALEASAALGRRIAALFDTDTDVPGVTSGTLPDSLRKVAVFGRLDGQSGGPVNYQLQARWGYRGQGGVVMPATGRITEQEDTVTIHANDTMGWHGVPRQVWEYKLGGYQVLKKWLSYREHEVLGRDLTVDEILHVTNTARRIAALIQLGPELDAAHAAVIAALT